MRLQRPQERRAVEPPDVVLAQDHARKAFGKGVDRELVSDHLCVRFKDLALRFHLTDHPEQPGAAVDGSPESFLPNGQGVLDAGPDARKDREKPLLYGPPDRTTCPLVQGTDAPGLDFPPRHPQAPLASPEAITQAGA